MSAFISTRALAAAVVTTTATIGLAPVSSAVPERVDGDRQVILAPTGSEGALEVDRHGQAVYSERFGHRSTFVPTPVHGHRFWLRTARITVGGEPLCLTLGPRGRVHTDPCDAARASQLFRTRVAGRASSQPTYLLIAGRQRHLVQEASGAFAAVRVGEGTADVETPFVLLDRGPAALPSLD